MAFKSPAWLHPPRTSPFVYPPALRSELEGCLGRFRLDVRYLGFMSTNPRRRQVLDDMKNLDDQWLRASLYLIEKHPADVMMFTFMSIDTVQHHFWQYMDPTHHYHDAKRCPGVRRRCFSRLPMA